jgi:hypothetical protein
MMKYLFIAALYSVDNHLAITHIVLDKGNAWNHVLAVAAVQVVKHHEGMYHFQQALDNLKKSDKSSTASDENSQDCSSL